MSSMKPNSNIEQVFQDGFKNFEADPGANAWSAIQSKMAANAAIGGQASASSISGSGLGLGKIAIGIVAISIIGIAGFVYLSNGRYRNC